MTSRQKRHAASCDGKVRHPDRAAALNHLGALARGGAYTARMQAYKCCACSTWHVGHKPGRRR